jgi:glycosyltransferase involved in cell wall biosynthesis
MKLSVVVPAYNEEKLLPESLRAILGAMAAFDDAELIVCDNNSTDATGDIARAAGARVVFEPLNQISRARNAGALAARGDWLLFIDADSFPSLPLFLDVRKAIAGGNVLAGGATVAYPHASLPARAALGSWNLLSRTMRWAAGSFIFVEAVSFYTVGGFSEELFAGEEIDLFRRLKRRAQAQGRSIVILHRHPLVSSDRKLALYGWADLTRFLLKTVVTGGRTLRRKEDCPAWYDGRR